jgi:hypothetical protein
MLRCWSHSLRTQHFLGNNRILSIFFSFILTSNKISLFSVFLGLTTSKRTVLDCSETRLLLDLLGLSLFSLSESESESTSLGFVTETLKENKAPMNWCEFQVPKRLPSKSTDVNHSRIGSIMIVPGFCIPLVRVAHSARVCFLWRVLFCVWVSHFWLFLSVCSCVYVPPENSFAFSQFRVLPSGSF